MQNIKIFNTLESCVIDIEGAIGVAEEWQFENAGDRVATYEKFRESLAAIEALEAQRVIVNIRSTGGDVNDALLIYEALTSLEIPITTRCYGYVASAATVIAQAASEGERQISANALYLVHNSTCAAEGNASDLKQRMELLQKTDERLAELYARRSGREVEEFTALMAEEGGNGRWLNAQEAIESGLADSVIETTSEAESSTIKNFWQKLADKLGISDTTTDEQQPLEIPQSDHTVLHTLHSQELSAQRVNTFAEHQAIAAPTTLKKVEDPSFGEVQQSKNQKAYHDDVQALRR